MALCGSISSSPITLVNWRLDLSVGRLWWVPPIITSWSSHHWRRCTILRDCVVVSWMLLGLHWRNAHLVLVPVSLSCHRFWLIPVSLGCIVHFDRSSKNCLSLHLLKSAFRFFFNAKFNKSISLGNTGDRITYDFSLVYRWIHLLEGLHQQDVVDTGFEVTHVDLMPFTPSRHRLVSESRLLRGKVSGGSSTSHTSTMGGPVELKVLV